jgi:hypothetical protein
VAKQAKRAQQKVQQQHHHHQQQQQEQEANHPDSRSGKQLRQSYPPIMQLRKLQISLWSSS